MFIVKLAQIGQKNCKNSNLVVGSGEQDNECVLSDIKKHLWEQNLSKLFPELCALKKQFNNLHTSI